jgi:hypothetical protein
VLAQQQHLPDLSIHLKLWHKELLLLSLQLQL